MKISLFCLKCGSEFFRKPSEIARGRNKFCSKKCTSPDMSKRNQNGFNNPNWKGGIRTWVPTTEYLRNKQRDYRTANPEKNRAHQLISDAIRIGKIKRMPCVLCSRKVSEAHHPDYSKPFEITWLCKRCHMKEHVIIGRGAIVDAVQINAVQRVQK